MASTLTFRKSWSSTASRTASQTWDSKGEKASRKVGMPLSAAKAMALLR